MNLLLCSVAEWQRVFLEQRYRVPHGCLYKVLLATVPFPLKPKNLTFFRPSAPAEDRMCWTCVG